jgi:hypothetical protein
MDSLTIDPDLDPGTDETFLALLQRALEGELPVYAAAVPPVLIIPHNPDFRPDQVPRGQLAIEATYEDWCAGQVSWLVVYPRGRWYVLSDDYIPLFAALRGMPDYLPCLILGTPDDPMLQDLQGPLTTDALWQTLYGPSGNASGGR